MKGFSWTEATLNTLDLLLDPLNPRVDVNEEANQEEIRLHLLKYEEIVELANEIVRDKRLLPGDRIITYIEDGKHVVLEGNRRICACQLLLDPTLIPPGYEKRFPRADSEDLILNISQIKADVAPNRNAAENVLTKRHTEPGIKKWSPIAKMRRVARWYNQGETIKEIATRIGASTNNVRRSIHEYHLLKFVLDLSEWTLEELDILRDEKLAVNPYTRFFTLARTKEVLKLEFDESGYPKSKLPEKVFKDSMRCIARAFLLPDHNSNGKPWANTRTTEDEIFDKCQEVSKYNCLGKPEQNGQNSQDVQNTTNASNSNNTQDTQDAQNKQDTSNAQDKQGGENTRENGDSKAEASQDDKGKEKANTTQNKTPKPARFFENLNCSIDDQRLIQLSIEIKMINHTRMPIAATMLVRALLESSLRYQLVKIGKFNDLVNSKGEDPGLSKILNYCADKNNKVFRIKRASDVLNSFSGTGFKDAFDFIVHGNWAEPNPLTLEQSASMLRPLISYILNNEHLNIEDWGGPGAKK